MYYIANFSEVNPIKKSKNKKRRNKFLSTGAKIGGGVGLATNALGSIPVIADNSISSGTKAGIIGSGVGLGTAKGVLLGSGIGYLSHLGTKE